MQILVGLSGHKCSRREGRVCPHHLLNLILLASKVASMNEILIQGDAARNIQKKKPKKILFVSMYIKYTKSTFIPNNTYVYEGVLGPLEP